MKSRTYQAPYQLQHSLWFEKTKNKRRNGEEKVRNTCWRRGARARAIRGVFARALLLQRGLLTTLSPPYNNPETIEEERSVAMAIYTREKKEREKKKGGVKAKQRWSLGVGFL